MRTLPAAGDPPLGAGTGEGDELRPQLDGAPARREERRSAGNRGDDLAFLGERDDAFRWDPGDASDTVEGAAGIDRLVFNGSNASEHVDVSANGSRVRFFRDVASVMIDLNEVDNVFFNALGGADAVKVNDLAGTGVQTTPSLSRGGGDFAAVNGLAAKVAISHPEIANDRLELDTRSGDDTVDSSGLEPGVIRLFIHA